MGAICLTVLRGVAIAFVFVLPNVACAALVEGFRAGLPNGSYQLTERQANLIANTTVYVGSVSQRPAANAPFHIFPGAGTHLARTDLPGPGWRAAYTWCRTAEPGCQVGLNAVNRRPLTAGTEVSITVSAGESISLWWWYIPPPRTAPADPPGSYIHVVDSRMANAEYAYSPALIHEDGTYHAFVCSRGDLTGISNYRAWDFIRHTQSDDGISWSAPSVVVTGRGGLPPSEVGYTVAQGQNISACDPSVIKWGEYYYLYYGGAKDTGNRPVVQGSPQVQYSGTIEVARSLSLSGPYEYYLTNGTWGMPSPNVEVKAIIDAMIIPTDELIYGAGQPSVVVRDGVLHMWYTDTTHPDSVPERPAVHMLTSSNPVVWTPSLNALVTADEKAINDNDVKFDPVRNQFVMYRIGRTDWNHYSSGFLDPWLEVSYSDDGMSWPSFTQVLEPAMFPWGYWATGFLSDARGFVKTTPGTQFAYAAPYDMNTDPVGYALGDVNYARFDLIATTAPTLHSTLQNSTAFGGQWPDFEFGEPGDVPFVMEKNGFHFPVVYRATDQTWRFPEHGLSFSQLGVEQVVQFGSPGDVPMILRLGHMDRFAVYRPSAPPGSAVIVSTDNQDFNGHNSFAIPAVSPIVPPHISFVVSAGPDSFDGEWGEFSFGTIGDYPMLIQLEDGQARLPATYRPEGGNWFINLGGYVDHNPAQTKYVQFGGVAGDKPEIVRYNGGDRIAVRRAGVGLIVSLDNENMGASNFVILP